MPQFEAKFDNLNVVPQKKYRSAAQKIMLNVIFTSNWIMDQVRPFVEPENITMQQFNILRILRGSKQPLSLVQIRGSLLDKMSDTSRIIDRLILKGLVEKTPGKNDKRALDITITEKGRKILAAIDEKDAQFDAVTKNITEEEAIEVCRILDKMRGVKS